MSDCPTPVPDWAGILRDTQDHLRRIQEERWESRWRTLQGLKREVSALKANLKGDELARRLAASRVVGAYEALADAGEVPPLEEA